MSTKIYKVLSNLKHDGTLYEKGMLIEAEAVEAFDALVKDGVLREIEASTLEEAQKIDAAATAETAKPQTPVKPQNTWGPTAKEEAKPAEATAGADTKAPEDKTAETNTSDKPTVEVGTGDQPPAPNEGDKL